MDESFPEGNRGKQQAANCFLFFAFTTLFSIKKFNSRTIDIILTYADRLYTYTTLARIAELRTRNGLKLNDEEINNIVRNECFGLREITKNFCLEADKVSVQTYYDYTKGELNAKDLDEENNVYKALTLLFADKNMGVVEAKGFLYAIFRRGGFFYLFDPNSRGPSGLRNTNGVACITRYSKLEDLVETYLHNLPKCLWNIFSVHYVSIHIDNCPREEVRKMKVKIKSSPYVTSFLRVCQGKTIVRGTLAQDHKRFGRKPNAQSAPMAFVALGMALVHKCMFWTKPIVDEIVMAGDKLYEDALDMLGFSFNPWEEELSVDLVPRDFKLGSLKVNCEVRPYDQEGILFTRHSKTLNLRQGNVPNNLLFTFNIILTSCELKS